MKIEILNKDNEKIITKDLRRIKPALVLRVKNGKATLKIEDGSSADESSVCWFKVYTGGAGIVKLNGMKTLAKLFEPILDFYFKNKDCKYREKEFSQTLNSIYDLCDDEENKKIFQERYVFDFKEYFEILIPENEDYDDSFENIDFAKMFGIKTKKDITSKKVYKKIVKLADEHNIIYLDIPEGLECMYRSNLLKLKNKENVS